MEYAINVENICKSYGSTKALDNICFKVKKGEVVGLLGPNGAGKSSIMRILVGLTHADSGSAYMYGMPIDIEKQQIRNILGYMPEHNPLFEDMRVHEYLSYRAHLKKIPTNRIKERIQIAMHSCDLQHKAKNKLIKDLSKGYKQRVGIADTILAEPQIIILDEPTIGLDPHQIIAIRNLIQELKRKTTVIFSSHILQEIESVCDSVIILNHGHVVATGTPEELKSFFIKERSCKISWHAPLIELKHAFFKYLIDFNVLTEEEREGISTLVFKTKNVSCVYSAINILLRERPDWSVLEVSCQEPNLEDVFISATQKNWDTL